MCHVANLKTLNVSYSELLACKKLKENIMPARFESTRHKP